GHAGERLEMVGTGGLGREQQKDQIDRLAVERLELDRPIEPGEQPEQPFELRQLAMRDGDAVADAGGAELLALLQDLEDLALALAGELGGACRELLDRLLLAVDLKRGNDRLRRNEIGERHMTRGPECGKPAAQAKASGRRTIRRGPKAVNRRGM